MTKKDFISAAKYYGLTVYYSGNKKIFYVTGKKGSIGISAFMVSTAKNFCDALAIYTENVFDTFKKERERLNCNVPAGTPKTPPNGSNGKNNVILVIIILIGIVLYSVLVDSLLKLICK